MVVRNFEYWLTFFRRR